MAANQSDGGRERLAGFSASAATVIGEWMRAFELRTMAMATLVLAILVLAGCAGDGAVTNASVASTGTSLVDQRPYRFHVPRSYDRTRPAALVIVLHGYAMNGALQDFYFGFKRLSERRGFLVAYPDGERGPLGLRFWNGIPLQDDTEASLPHDVAYITAIIDDMSARYKVDARRVYLVGHSNGGFMAYRYACERPTRVAAIAVVAGAMPADASTCSPSARVAILHIHGDGDLAIAYSGGTMRRVPYFRRSDGTSQAVTYLGAVESVARWAAINGCGPLQPARMALDLDRTLPDEETWVWRHDDCAGGAAELWSIRGGGHAPALALDWANTVYDWLIAHVRP
jgi:polyhydroxybutyrate depolymerase